MGVAAIVSTASACVLITAYTAYLRAGQTYTVQHSNPEFKPFVMAIGKYFRISSAETSKESLFPSEKNGKQYSDSSFF